MTTVAISAPPQPVLNSVFPAGGCSGCTVEVSLTGQNLDAVHSLRCSHSKISATPGDEGRWLITIPEDVPPGSFDLQAITENGLSSTRTFVVGNRAELLEDDASNDLANAQTVPLDVVVNGRIEQGGDLDHFRFTAEENRRVIIECRSERIDSPLRAVLEVFDADGSRLAVNRGYFGIDPLIDFRVPRDGEYIVRVYDLVYSGSADHIYRLEIDTGPRVLFAFPNVIERDKTTPVTLYGWNLQQADELPGVTATSISGVPSPPEQSPQALDRIDVEITPPAAALTHVPLRQASTEVGLEQFAYHLPGAHAPVSLSLTDVPVTTDADPNHDPTTAIPLTVPCDVSGQLAVPEETDWFTVEARRGEVLWIEAFGERIGSPVDLEISLFDEDAGTELAHFGDEASGIGGKRFALNHVDPIGRWVAPDDGRYLIMARNLTPTPQVDPRRLYRLSVRREEPDFALAIVPRSEAPSALNVPRGGRLCVDLVALRKRGLNESIRVTAHDLPSGLECPDVWLGPRVSRAPLVLSANDASEPFVGGLTLLASSESVTDRPVRGSTVVRGGRPTGWSRLIDQPAVSVSGQAPLRLTADGHETRPHHLYGDLDVRHSPGGILDVAVYVDRQHTDYTAPVRLTGVGVPDLIPKQTFTIPADQEQGHISFYLPPTLPVGTYTIAVQGETTVPAGEKNEQGEQPTENVTVISNPVTFEVQPAAFTIELDPFAPRQIRRGEIVQVGYRTRRVNGFIGKIHTELYAAGPVVGLRGRGVTFVGQTETGQIQVIANEDAPLGRQPSLRLYGVGVVEDEPVFHGSCFLDLEIVE